MLFGLLCLACTGSPIDLDPSDAAASSADVAELLARIEALEQTQAEQAQRLDDAEGALAECLATAENADANARAAQDRSAELRAEIDDGELWGRLEALESDLSVLWIAVEALFDA